MEANAPLPLKIKKELSAVVQPRHLFSTNASPNSTPKRKEEGLVPDKASNTKERSLFSLESNLQVLCTDKLSEKSQESQNKIPTSLGEDKLTSDLRTPKLIK
eukprot:CAMPEP_0170505126 /NCGR_PEP_ID=MMETSP0208-20121228/49930_1 /TAXON_ID=197538 /ORGANISM="Strombidium inclinatum, Strain S3" /LENGTH=101 /DNA_ID=CAMNT_0010785779 /DNA_START=69 /DNA_END=374 /DNA_ORIENTATION=+